MTFVFKYDKTIGSYRYGWKSFRQNYNEQVMKAGKEETTCLLGVGGKGSVKASVQVPVKGMKYESPAHELVIKNGKAERSCLPGG